MQNTDNKITCTTVSIKNDKAKFQKKAYTKNLCYNNEIAPKVLLLTWNNLVEKAFHVKNLLTAYYEIKSRLKISIWGINQKWFEKTSASLIDGSFKCPKRCVVYTPKWNLNKIRSFTWVPSSIRIIELSILNAIQPLFEGTFIWNKISEIKFYELLKNSEMSKNLKKNKSGFFHKIWIKKSIFSTFSYGQRPNLSVHNALQSAGKSFIVVDK